MPKLSKIDTSLIIMLAPICAQLLFILMHCFYKFIVVLVHPSSYLKWYWQYNDNSDDIYKYIIILSQDIFLAFILVKRKNLFALVFKIITCHCDKMTQYTIYLENSEICKILLKKNSENYFLHSIWVMIELKAGVWVCMRTLNMSFE